MYALVGLLAAAACVAAQPAFLHNYDLPFYRNLYNPITYPINPFVRSVTPEIYPHYHLPHYAGLKSQYYDRDLIGQARYGHIEPGQSHHAVQDAFGNKVGSFSFFDAEGKLQRTSYIADAAGYRVTSDELPKVVLDTPDVVAAKIAHFSEHAKIRSRLRRQAILTPASTTPIFSPISDLHYHIASPVPHAFPTTHTLPVVRPDGFLADTPEVTAAKALHFAEVEAAKVRNISPLLPIVPSVAPVFNNYRNILPFNQYFL